MLQRATSGLTTSNEQQMNFNENEQRVKSYASLWSSSLMCLVEHIKVFKVTLTNWADSVVTSLKLIVSFVIFLHLDSLLTQYDCMTHHDALMH